MAPDHLGDKVPILIENLAIDFLQMANDYRPAKLVRYFVRPLPHISPLSTRVSGRRGRRKIYFCFFLLLGLFLRLASYLVNHVKHIRADLGWSQRQDVSV